MIEPIVKVFNLTKKFRVGKVNVIPLRGVSLDIFPGEFLIINGPSGSGKTTLLNLIAGLDQYDSGELIIENKNIKDFSPTDLVKYRRATIGMVFQNFNLISSLSVLENVVLPLEFSGVSNKIRTSRAKEVLEMVGLKDRVKHFPGELSGGEQQRVAIARALAGNPRILIVDEPTGNLDKKSGQEIMQLLQEINKSFGTTILLVTHDTSYLMMANRILYMEDGYITKQTTIPDKLRKEMTGKDSGIQDFAPNRIQANMKFWDILRISYKHFCFARTRVFLTIFGLVIGIFAIVLLTSLGFGLQNITTAALVNFDSLQTITVTIPQDSNLKLDDQSIIKMKTISHVKEVVPSKSLTVAGAIDATTTGAILKGINADNLKGAQISLSSGKPFVDSSLEVVVSQAMLKSLDIKDSAGIVGKEMTITSVGEKPITQKFVISGISDNTVTPEVYTSLNSFNKMVDAPYDTMAVKVDNRNEVGAVQTAIDDLGFETSASSDLVKKINSAFMIIQLILGLIGGIALVVASFGIINTMTISLLERTHEIGIMKALGISGKDIKRLFLYESSFYGLFGGMIGIAIGWLIGLGINQVLIAVMKNAGQAETLTLFVTPWKFVILVFVFSVLIARFAGIYPAWRAAKSSPLDALRYE